MEVTIEVPSLEDMRAEVATVVRWMKKEGDQVREGEPVVLLEFPKMEFEVMSPASGRLAKILKKEGRMVRVHDSIGMVQT